jgi:hypothetical protein
MIETQSSWIPGLAGAEPLSDDDCRPARTFHQFAAGYAKAFL